jgi:hypothetical protein
MDLGLRNSIISNFNDLSLRNDLSELFENFCLMELLQIDPQQFLGCLHDTVTYAPDWDSPLGEDDWEACR